MFDEKDTGVLHYVKAVHEGTLALQESVSDIHTLVGKLSAEQQSTSKLTDELRRYVIEWRDDSSERIGALERVFAHRISGLERKFMTAEEAQRSRDLVFSAADASLQKAIAAVMADAEEDRRRAEEDRKVTKALDDRTRSLEEDRKAMKWWVRAGVLLVLVIVPAMLAMVGYVLQRIPPEAWHTLAN